MKPTVLALGVSCAYAYNIIDKNKAMKVAVIAHPNSKRPRIEKDLLGTLHVYVNQPPLEGKANKAVILALAEYFNVGKTTVKIISGAKIKNKLFEIIE